MDSKSNAELVALIRKSNPCASLQSIGDRLGISRERVRQLLKKQNLPTKGFHQRYECLNCGKAMPAGKTTYCNKQCRHEYTHPIVSCHQCGKLFNRGLWAISRTVRNPKNTSHNFFCSSQCVGKWLGQQRLKYDYEAIWFKHLETGYGSVLLSRLLGIRKSSVARIFSRMRSLKE